MKQAVLDEVTSQLRHSLGQHGLGRAVRRFETVWCAAGTPHAVFEVGTEALIGAIPGASVLDVS